LDLARWILRSWESQAPEDLEVLLLRANVELRGGAYERALDAANKVLHKQPTNKKAAMYRSQAQERLKRRTQENPPL
jgi:hypothetical protein